MITEDEATRLLKRADPARVDDSAPILDAAGYLAALRTRSTTVTLINTEPNPTQPEHRRRWPIIATAAAVVAILVGGVVLATRDDDPNEQIPAATTVVPDASAAEAEEIARGFVDAYVAGDADRALNYLAEDFIASYEPWGSPQGFRLDLAWQEPARYEWNVHDCQRLDPALAASGQQIGTIVRCSLDFHALGSDAIALGPYDMSWDLTVRDGKIVSPSPDGAWDWTPQYEAELWGPFADWIRTEHPNDVLVMYRESDQDWSQTTDESFRLWEQRTEEFVQAVLTGRETYAADVAAICATQAAQLGELAAPAEGALDQIAAWNAAAAAILRETRGALNALVRPPAMDITTYSDYNNRKLIILIKKIDSKAEVASAGDSTRLAELDAEYLEVRQTMSSGPAGSGLEECVASLPG